jgi:hypothetical protein
MSAPSTATDSVSGRAENSVIKNIRAACIRSKNINGSTKLCALVQEINRLLGEKQSPLDAAPKQPNVPTLKD